MSGMISACVSFRLLYLIFIRIVGWLLVRYCWEAVALYRGGTDPGLR